MTHWRTRILVITFVFNFAIPFGAGLALLQTFADAKRTSAQVLAQGYAQRIQEKVQTALLSTYLLSALIKQSNGHLEDFNYSAAEILALFPGVSALQIAPNGVIERSYPLVGNEASIGHDLLADVKRNQEAVEAIIRRQVTLTGPFPLVQGGTGAVGRLPVFMTYGNSEGLFWGFVSALIRIPVLVESVGLMEIEKLGYRYELWRTHPETEKKEIIAASNTDHALDSPVDYIITVYGRRWILSLAPIDGWQPQSEILVVLLLSGLIASVLTFLSYIGLRSMQRECRKELQGGSS